MGLLAQALQDALIVVNGEEAQSMLDSIADDLEPGASADVSVWGVVVGETEEGLVVAARAAFRQDRPRRTEPGWRLLGQVKVSNRLWELEARLHLPAFMAESIASSTSGAVTALARWTARLTAMQGAVRGLQADYWVLRSLWSRHWDTVLERLVDERRLALLASDDLGRRFGMSCELALEIQSQINRVDRLQDQGTSSREWGMIRDEVERATNERRTYCWIGTGGEYCEVSFRGVEMNGQPVLQK